MPKTYPEELAEWVKGREAKKPRQDKHVVAFLAVKSDVQAALDAGYARKLGVNLDDLLVSQPNSGEEALTITEQLVKSGALDVVVVDSVAALAPQAELDGSMGDHIKVSPLSSWRPKKGERIGIMVSGLARTQMRSVRERSNVYMVTWP